MVIERVHGLHATGLSLNDRFSLLASAPPDRFAMRQKRRPIGAFMNTNMNFRNRNIIEQIARRLEQQARRARRFDDVIHLMKLEPKRPAARPQDTQAVKQRLGMGPLGGLRRFGSENSLPNLRRSNSFGSLTQDRNIRQRIGWRQSNGNLSRSASFGDLSVASWGGRSRTNRRRGGQRPLRGRFRGRIGVGRVTRVPQRVFTRGPQGRGRARGQGRGAARGINRGAARGRGRGGMVRTQTPKLVMSKEELDAQLEQYMAGSKAALDKELDAYMKNAMDLE